MSPKYILVISIFGPTRSRPMLRPSHILQLIMCDMNEQTRKQSLPSFVPAAWGRVGWRIFAHALLHGLKSMRSSEGNQPHPTPLSLVLRSPPRSGEPPSLPYLLASQQRAAMSPSASLQLKSSCMDLKRSLEGSSATLPGDGTLVYQLLLQFKMSCLARRKSMHLLKQL
jgi:hypothetical protein